MCVPCVSHVCINKTDRNIKTDFYKEKYKTNTKYKKRGKNLTLVGVEVKSAYYTDFFFNCISLYIV